MLHFFGLHEAAKSPHHDEELAITRPPTLMELAGQDPITIAVIPGFRTDADITAIVLHYRGTK